jgi:hypothetical protein
MTDYAPLVLCLKENLELLTQPDGRVLPDDQIMWNLSNALLHVSDALRDMQAQVTHIEQRLSR